MILLGQCCGGCLDGLGGGAGGFQSVCGLVTWPLGRLPLDPASTDGSSINLPVGVVANICYLKVTVTQKIAGLELINGTEWDLNDNLTNFGPASPLLVPDPTGALPQPAYISGPLTVSGQTATGPLQVDFADAPSQYGTITITLSNPYTYAQVVADAVALLGQVQLLNPNVAYQVTAGYAGIETGVIPVYFGYPWQQNGRTEFTNRLTVTRGGITAGAVDDAWIANATSFANGFVAPSGTQIFVKKTAYFSSTGWTSQSSVIAVPAAGTPYGFSWGGGVAESDSFGAIYYGLIQPVNYPPGEHIFDNTNVPGYGITAV